MKRLSIIPLFALAVCLSACVSFSNRAYKAELTAVALADRAMSCWGTYWDTAIKDPAANNTTAEKLWNQRDRVNKASKVFTLGVNKLDKMRQDYEVKLATKAQVNEALADVAIGSDVLVKIVRESLPPAQAATL